MNRIKICGLKRMEDILAVNECRPEYIGFVFADTRRFVKDETAAALKKALHPDIKAVGVFVDEPIAHIVKLVWNGTIDMIQLHGREDKNYVNQLKKELNKTGKKEKGEGNERISEKHFFVPIIKAVRIDASVKVTKESKAEIIKENQRLIGEAKALQVDYLLFDARVKGIPGGSGKTFDIAALPPDESIGMPYFLAGGIGLHNVKRIIDLRNPYGIDVSSAVETDGHKDKEKIKDLIKEIRKESK